MRKEHRKRYLISGAVLALLLVGLFFVLPARCVADKPEPYVVTTEQFLTENLALSGGRYTEWAALDGAHANKSMAFKTAEHDFGTFREEKGTVSYVFEVTNRGGTPFVIEDVQVTCGCTTPKFSREPVMPGKTAKITIEYDPANRPGKFVNSIGVMSNNMQSVNTLTIKGEVLPRPRTVEDDYPIEVGQGVRIDRLTVNFGRVAQRTPAGEAIKVVNHGKKDVALRFEMRSSNGYVEVKPVAVKLAPNQKTEMNLSAVIPDGAFWGSWTGDVFVTVDGKRYENPIRVTATITDDFGKMRELPDNKWPQAKYNSYYHNFKTGDLTRVQTNEFTLTNSGGSTLVVRSVQLETGASCDLKPGQELAPGREMKFRASVDPKSIESSSGVVTVRITTNDPRQPLRAIRLRVSGK